MFVENLVRLFKYAFINIFAIKGTFRNIFYIFYSQIFNVTVVTLFKKYFKYVIHMIYSFFVIFNLQNVLIIKKNYSSMLLRY